MRKIIEMNCKEVKKFLLKDSSYFNLELPPYYTFNNLLNEIEKQINRTKQLNELCKDKPNECENVNYKLFYNKDGKFDWRPIELINPILYVYLVKLISEEDNWKEIKRVFKEFQKNEKIICCSIPIESYNRNLDKKETILNWWDQFEQNTISKSLIFNWMAITDITNCYGSIYTHSISWALEGKEEAKKNKQNKKTLGNQIDQIIRAMSYGQTNGIPQGSVLMDFIAEIILGYADLQLGKKIKKNNIEDYCILRFRDDYRIFAKNEFDLKMILKYLTEVLIDLNFKLNSNKTLITDDIITNSIKKDKENELVNNYIIENNIQKSLYNIRKVSILYPNSGTVIKSLIKLYETQIKISKKINYIEQIISILVDIMYRNSRMYSVGTMILSYILNLVSDREKEKYIKHIIDKFKNIPNTDYLEIWIQRMMINTNLTEKFNSKLCMKIQEIGIDEKIKIWNNEWAKNIEVNELLIIDYTKLKNINPIIEEKEVNSFLLY